mmetsp:Transcript_23753/g.65890  ORF Transcript_23753/g.65890 Transcript_23753/m.65890 type:complete len:242 (-) Transcript_23753:321-1046(-)
MIREVRDSMAIVKENQCLPSTLVIHTCHRLKSILSVLQKRLVFLANSLIVVAQLFANRKFVGIPKGFGLSQTWYIRVNVFVWPPFVLDNGWIQQRLFVWVKSVFHHPGNAFQLRILNIWKSRRYERRHEIPKRIHLFLVSHSVQGVLGFVDCPSNACSRGFGCQLLEQGILFGFNKCLPLFRCSLTRSICKGVGQSIPLALCALFLVFLFCTATPKTTASAESLRSKKWFCSAESMVVRSR